MQTAQVVSFIRQVQRQVGRPLIVIMDRLPAHRSAARCLRGDERFSVEWLPAYAPDLNPVEAAWSQTKYTDLANYVAEDVVDLKITAQLALEATQEKQPLLRSFFQAARLKL